MTITTAEGGTLEISDDGTFEYTPGDDFVGTESITYTITGENGGEDTATIVFTVFDLPPEPVDDVNSTSANTPVQGNILDNDLSEPNDDLQVADDDGNPLTSVVTLTTDQGGTVTIGPDGNYTYQPRLDFAGEDSISFVIVDENGNIAESTLTLFVADVGVAKSIVGDPVELDNGNFSLTYEVVVENLGAYAISDLSLVENLADQFGDAFVSASGLTFVTDPSSDSQIILNEDWDGRSETEILQADSDLALGDRFVFRFDVEVDTAQFDATDVAGNQIVATGTAVDAEGNPVTTANGSVVGISDRSDSGTDPNSTNPGAPGDTGATNDPTRLYIPSVGVAKLADFAVPNGDNIDVRFTIFWINNGTTSLTGLSLHDDVAAAFGDQFVSVTGLSIDNFNGTGTAPTVDADWEGDTTRNILIGGTANQGDSFEVSFTVTLSRDSSGSFGSPANRAIGGGEGLDDQGQPLLNIDGDAVQTFDQSDSGDNPSTENGFADDDGIAGNDETLVEFGDLAISKAFLGLSDTTINGHSILTFRLNVENVGTATLSDLSLVEELVTQIGPSFVNADNLLFVESPTDPDSVIQLSSTWNGRNDTELLSTSTTNRLAAGDSFTFEFEVEVDLLLAEGNIENQVTGSGIAVDENGQQIVDRDGNPIRITDVSDNGLAAASENGEDNGDGVFGNDITPIDLSIDPSGYFYDVETGEILTGGSLSIVGPTPDSVQLIDAGEDGSYQFFGTVEGTYIVHVTVPPGYELDASTLQRAGIDPTGLGDPLVLGSDDADGDGFLDNPTPTDYYLRFDLEAGDPYIALNNLAFRRIQPQGTTGNPPNLPNFAPLYLPSTIGILSGFLGSPGPIYSGGPDSVGGGYVSEFGIAGILSNANGQGCCCCEEPVIDECETPTTKIICGECDLPVVEPPTPGPMESLPAPPQELEYMELMPLEDIENLDNESTATDQGDVSELETETETNVDTTEADDSSTSKPSLMVRMKNWLR